MKPKGKWPFSPQLTRQKRQSRHSLLPIKLQIYLKTFSGWLYFIRSCFRQPVQQNAKPGTSENISHHIKGCLTLVAHKRRMFVCFFKPAGKKETKHVTHFQKVQRWSSTAAEMLPFFLLRQPLVQRHERGGCGWMQTVVSNWAAEHQTREEKCLSFSWDWVLTSSEALCRYLPSERFEQPRLYSLLLCCTSTHELF